MDKFEILEYLNEHPECVNVLRLAVEHEEGNAGEEHYLGWEWTDVRAYAATINKLIVTGLVKKTYNSANFTNYKLVKLEATKEALRDFEALTRRPAPVEEVKVPEDLFSVIIEFDSIKEVFLKSLAAENPVHILLVSPPAVASKSLWMMELERLPGSVFVSLGGTSTRVGLRDIIAMTPRYLILDEIDKVQSSSDLSALLGWMESGRITIAKHDYYRDIRGRGWVFAAANSTRGLSPELLSRFMVFNIPPYTREQYREVAKGVLVAREGVEEELAEFIARRMTEEGFEDVREPVRIARLVKRADRPREEVEKTIRVLKEYRGDLTSFPLLGVRAWVGKLWESVLRLVSL